MCGGDPPPPSAKDKEQIDKYNENLEKTRENFKNGPIANRKITDCCCCLIFIVAIVGFFAASAYGWMNGNPRKLLIGWDGDKRGCGWTESVVDYPYLYWPNEPSGKIKEAVESMDVDKALELLNNGVCVKECPTGEKTEAVQCLPTSIMLADPKFSTVTNQENFPGNASCIQSIDLSYLEEWGIDVEEYTGFTKEQIESGTDNAPLTYPFRYTTKQLYGFCVPDLDVKGVSGLSEEAIKTFKKLFQDTVMGDKLTSYLADIAYSWKVILVCSVTAIVLGYIYLLLIRCMGALIIWLSIILLQLSLIGGGLYMYMESDSYDEESDYRDYLKYAAYAIWGVAGLFLCCVCCCWRSIQIGIAVYSATAEYVAKNLRIFFLPLIAYFVCAIWLTGWLASAVFVFSIGEPTSREGYPFITEMKWDENTRYIVLYQLFMLFWINAFIMGMCQFIIAASACIWYFEVNSDTGGAGTVGRGVYWAFRFHMGSVAFGAAIIAICQIIRVIFEYYRKKIQAATQNACVKCLLCYTGYLLWALEKCIKYITKNAYIQVALTNDWFCLAAWNAFSLILKNVATFGWLNTIGFVLNWFGVCGISCLNAFGGYIVLTRLDYYKLTITQPFVVCIVIGLMTFFVAKSFLSIFSFSMDAILQSFLLDEALGFAGQARPKSMEDFKEKIDKRTKSVIEK